MRQLAVLSNIAIVRVAERVHEAYIEAKGDEYSNNIVAGVKDAIDATLSSSIAGAKETFNDATLSEAIDLAYMGIHAKILKLSALKLDAAAEALKLDYMEAASSTAHRGEEL